AEALLVQIAQSPLIIVMIRRTKQRAAQVAPRDVRKISFDRIGLSDVDLVKILFREAKCIVLEKLLIRRNGSALSKLIKRRFRFRGQTNAVALRLFEEKPGQSEERICDRARFDLRGDIFNRLATRQKVNRNLGRD